MNASQFFSSKKRRLEERIDTFKSEFRKQRKRTMTQKTLFPHITTVQIIDSKERKARGLNVPKINHSGE